MGSQRSEVPGRRVEAMEWESTSPILAQHECRLCLSQVVFRACEAANLLEAPIEIGDKVGLVNFFPCAPAEARRWFFFDFSQGNLENLVGNLEGIFRDFSDPRNKGSNISGKNVRKFVARKASFVQDSLCTRATLVNFILPGLRSHALQPRAFSSLALSHPCTPSSSPSLARSSPGPRPVFAWPRPASPGPRPAWFQAILP